MKSDKLTTSLPLLTNSQALPVKEFCKQCDENIKISEKNLILLTKFKNILNEEPEDLEFHSPDTIKVKLDNQIEKSKKKKLFQYTNLKKESSRLNDLKLDPTSCFIWFIANKQEMKNLVPEIEEIRIKEVCCEMTSKNKNCPDGNFGLGKILAHEGKFDLALQHLKLATEQNENEKTYKLWYAVMLVLNLENKAQAVDAKMLCYRLLKDGYKTIEVYWTLMKLALSGILNVGTEIEISEHYAVRIKEIDDYYGFLAWSEISLAKQSSRSIERGEHILKEMINLAPERPEAYIMLWKYYNSKKDYENALGICEAGFLKLSAISCDYSVLISLKYAKSLFKQGKFSSCFELLQMEYSKFPLFMIFVYEYGKLCVKTQDPHFMGSAIGSLLECFRGSSEERYGQIYYWLSKAYLIAGEKIEAYDYMKKALSLLTTGIDKGDIAQERLSETKIAIKASELKELMRDMHGQIVNLDIITRILEGDTENCRYEECKIYCNAIRGFDKLEGDICEAKILWKLARKDEAMQLLYNDLTTQCFTMKIHFQVIEMWKIEKNYEEILKISKMILEYCKQVSVPVQLWVKINMIYGKALAKCRKVDKAIIVYKSLAKLQPKLYIPDVDYTKDLQTATTKEDLKSPAKPRKRIVNRKSIGYSEACLDFDARRAQLIASKKNLSTIVASDDVENDISTSYSVESHPKQVDFDQLDPSDSPRTNPFTKARTGFETLKWFSITTDYFFLYKIGKLSAKHEVYTQDGFFALHDFLNFHHYWMRAGVEADEELRVKALFWLGIICHQLEDYEQAYLIFIEIMSMLFQLGKVEMSERIQTCFRHYESLGIKPVNNL